MLIENIEVSVLFDNGRRVATPDQQGEHMRFLMGSAMMMVLGGICLQAETFSFSYSGVAVSLSGTQNVSAYGTLTATALGVGLYQVTSISGTRDLGSTAQTTTSTNITDPSGDLGLLYTSSGGQLGLDPGSAGIMAFGLAGMIGTDTLEYLSGVGYEETLVDLSNLLDSSTAHLTSFSIVAVPENSTLQILLALGLGIWILARKLHLHTAR